MLNLFLKKPKIEIRLFKDNIIHENILKRHLQNIPTKQEISIFKIILKFLNPNFYSLGVF